MTVCDSYTGHWNMIQYVTVMPVTLGAHAHQHSLSPLHNLF